MHIQIRQTGYHPPVPPGRGVQAPTSWRTAAIPPRETPRPPLRVARVDQQAWFSGAQDPITTPGVEQHLRLEPGGLSLHGAMWWNLGIRNQGGLVSMRLQSIDGWDTIRWQPLPLDNRWHIETVWGYNSRTDTQEVFGRLKWRLLEPVYPVRIDGRVLELLDQASRDLSGDDPAEAMVSLVAARRLLALIMLGG